MDLVVQVNAVEGDEAEDLDVLGRRLRLELFDLDVAAVEPVTSETAPTGAKGLSVVAGALAVRLAGDALVALVKKAKHWATRNGRTVEITIDGDTLKVTGISEERQEQLINVWLAKHTPGT